jgi:hypothetical protein
LFLECFLATILFPFRVTDLAPLAVQKFLRVAINPDSLHE